MPESKTGTLRLNDYNDEDDSRTAHIDDNGPETFPVETMEMTAPTQPRRATISSFFHGNEAAKLAAQHEKDMSFKYAIRYYWPAAM
jgi:hypothetical protein